MALNKEKITASAMKHLQKGALDKAVRDFEKILEAFPGDERTLQKVGDLYSRMGMEREALNAYKRVSDLYIKQGFYLKAIAVYKQILKLKPDEFNLRIRLAEIYQQLGLLSDSIHQYQVVYKHYNDEGKKKDALKVLKQITIIDPDNLPNRIRLAEGYFAMAMNKEGSEEYESAIEELKRSGRDEDHLRVLDRLVHRVPERIDLGQQLVGMMLERGESKKALARLKEVLKQDEQNVDTLELLGQAFHSQNELAKTVTVYLEIARILESGDDDERLRRIYGKVLEIDPENSEAKAGYDSLQKGSMQSASIGLADSRTESSLEEINTLSEVAKNGSAEPVDIGKLLTEAEVFSKYGLHDQAEERLSLILIDQPENREALSQLAQAQIKLDKSNEAENTLLLLAAILLEEDNGIEAGDALVQALALNNHDDPISSFIDAMQDGTSGNETIAAGIRAFLSGEKPPEPKQAEFDDDEIAALAGGEIIEDDEEETEEAEEGITLLSHESTDESKPFEEEASQPEEDGSKSESEVDFDQDVELILEESDEAPSEVLDLESDIIEEVEIPSHMIPEDDAGASIPPPPPSPKPSVRPPVLPEGDGIEVDEDFDDSSVEELLVDSEIDNFTEETVKPRPEPSPSASKDIEEQQIDLSTLELDSADADLPELDEENFESVQDLRSDLEEPTRDAVLDVEEIDISEQEAPIDDDFDEITSESLDELEVGPIDEDAADTDPGIELEVISEPSDSLPEVSDYEADISEADETPYETLDIDTIEAYPVEEDRPQEEEIELDPDEIIEEESLDEEDLELIVEEDEQERPAETQVEEAAPPPDGDPDDLSAALFEMELSSDDEKQPEEEKESEASETAFDEEQAKASLISRLEGDAQDDLDEAEFFFVQKVYGECIETYRDLLEVEKGNRLLISRIETCEREILAEKERKATIAVAQSKQDLDTSMQKTELLDVSPEELQATVFDPELAAGTLRTRKTADASTTGEDEVRLFGESVSDRDLDSVQTAITDENSKSALSARLSGKARDTHYNLGAAYFEKGLINEAIGEFLVSSKGASAMDSKAMLGFCYLQKDQTAKAADFFKQAAADPDMSKSALSFIHRNLARFYSGRQQTGMALLHYKSLLAIYPEDEKIASIIEEMEQTTSAEEADDIAKALISIDISTLPEGDPVDDEGNETGNISFV